jgi:hypothetical protein
MAAFNIAPSEMLVFLFGLLLAWMVGRLIVRFRARPAKGAAAPRSPAVLQAAIALAALLALWMFLRG